MSNVNVSEEELLALLEQSFEEGWLGYRDLKESTAEKILKSFLRKNKKKSEEPIKKNMEWQVMSMDGSGQAVDVGVNLENLYVEHTGSGFPTPPAHHYSRDLGMRHPTDTITIQGSEVGQNLDQNTTLDHTGTWITSDP